MYVVVPVQVPLTLNPFPLEPDVPELPELPSVPLLPDVPLVPEVPDELSKANFISGYDA